MIITGRVGQMNEKYALKEVVSDYKIKFESND